MLSPELLGTYHQFSCMAANLFRESGARRADVEIGQMSLKGTYCLFDLGLCLRHSVISIQQLFVNAVNFYGTTCVNAVNHVCDFGTLASKGVTPSSV